MLEKITESKSGLFICSLLATAVYFCLEPLLTQLYCIRAYSIVYWPYVVLKTVSIVLIFALFVVYLVQHGKNSRTGALFPIFLMMVGYLIPTLISGENLNVWVESFIQFMAYYILIMPLCYNKTVLRSFVRFVSWLYLVLAGINLFFLIRPDIFEVIGQWTSESFISTIENLAGFPLVMGLCFNLLDEHCNSSHIKLYVYFAIYLISNYLMWTAAQVLGAIIMVFYLIPPVRRLLDKVDLAVWTGIAFGLFVVFMWFWEPVMNLAPVRFLIDDVLKKDITFTGRLEIWQGVLDMVKERPILGHGLMDNPQYLYFDTGYNNNWAHAHSAFLQTLYEGGVLTLSCVAGVLFYTAKKIRQSADTHAAGIFKIIIFVFLLNLEMDQFFVYPWRSCLWCMICFLCNFSMVVSIHDN